MQAARLIGHVVEEWVRFLVRPAVTIRCCCTEKAESVEMEGESSFQQREEGKKINTPLSKAFYLNPDGCSCHRMCFTPNCCQDVPWELWLRCSDSLSSPWSRLPLLLHTSASNPHPAQSHPTSANISDFSSDPLPHLWFILFSLCPACRGQDKPEQ